MSTPMEMDCKEEVTSASGSMPTPLVEDSGEMKDPVEPQAKSVFDMTVVIRDLLPRVTSNKNQCKRIADRFNTINDEAMKSMEVQEDSELFKILRRGQILVQGYGDTTDITAREISNGDNRDEFKEFHEELHYAWAKHGFCWSLAKVEESDLHDDAEKDMEAIKLKMNQRIYQPSSDEGSKKQAQVVLEKTKNIDDLAGENLPSYLAIDSQSSDVVIKDVPEEPTMLNEMQFENELPSHLAIDRKSSMEIDDKRACREYERSSKQDPENEVGWVVVRPGTWLGCKFAFKVFKCNAARGLAFEWNKQELLKEARSLVALQHPHVVRFVGFGHNEESCLFVMEWMDGDLKKFMKDNVGGFEERDVIHQIAKGMYYMHERGYAHGDLKCTNIMAKKLDKRVVQVKIGDLRGSQKLGERDPAAFEAASKIRRPRWTAPEAIDKYGGEMKPTFEQLKQSDVYSFGMTCYEIVTGKLPYQNIFEKNGLLDYIRKGRVEEFNELPKELDEDLKAIIRKCWSEKPSDRPTFEEICLLLKAEPDRRSRYKDVAKSLLRQSCSLFSKHRSSTSSSGTRTPAPRLQVPSYVAIIPSARLQIFSLLGKGSAGRVYKATWLDCTFAVKKLKIPQTLQSEVGNLIEVSYHPFIVQLIGLCEESREEYWIVMECMDRNLRELVEGRKNWTQKIWTLQGRQEKIQKENLVIITKIALGLLYLHSKGLVHRDLKPNNVLVREYADTIDVKIVDFGVSHLKRITESNFGYFDGVGTGFYRAPEVMRLERDLYKLKSTTNEPAKLIVLNSDKGKELNESARLIIKKLPDEADLDAMKATDVYSFGMVCYMVLTGEDPYSGVAPSDYVKVWNGLVSLKWTSDPHPGLRSLVERCVRLVPTERPTFEQICKELHEISEPKPN